MRLLSLAIVFLSGAATLLYQVIWQRLLVLFTGADVYSVTIIVAAFMTGLGVGSLAGGRLADRRSPRQNLRLFAGAEVAVGVFALASKWLLYDFLYTRLSSLSGSAAGTVVLFLVLLWPTFFMGLSLPLLARALTGSIDRAGRVVGSLYGWNTLGGAVGALVTTWSLLPRNGLAGTIPIGAAANILCALAAWTVLTRTVPGAVGERSPGDSTLKPAPDMSTKLITAAGPRFSTWVVTYCLTGFMALATELIWFRLLGVMLKSTAFTFGTMLAVYLTGLGAGAAVGARLVRFASNPGRLFLALQVLATLISGVTLILLTQLVSSGQPETLASHFARTDYSLAEAITSVRDIIRGTATGTDATRAREFVSIYLLLPITVIGLPTALMGATFPLLQQAAQADFGRLGRRVGILMAANIAGSAAGAIVTGLVLLPWLGTAASFSVIVALALVPAWLWARLRPFGSPRLAFVAAAALVVLTIVAMPSGSQLWAVLHGSHPKDVLIEEHGAGVTVLKGASNRLEGPVFVYVNGLSQSWLPFGDVHTALGALPALVHPAPRDIAVIGLGSGDTAFSAGGRNETQRITCIEIIGGQHTALSRLTREFPDPGLRAMLADPRIEHVVGDGRAYLLRSDRRFDIVEADALRPETAFSGNLYSREYFGLLRDRLKPGGFAVTWAATERVAATFMYVFPYVLQAGPVHIGSVEPIAFDPAVVRERMEDIAFADYYRRAGIDIRALLRLYIDAATVVGPDTPRAPVRDLNSDLFPRDEFRLPRILDF